MANVEVPPQPLAPVFTGVYINGEPMVGTMTMIYDPARPREFVFATSDTDKSSPVQFATLGAVKTQYRPAMEAYVTLEFTQQLPYKGIHIVEGKLVRSAHLGQFDQILRSEEATCLPALKRGSRSQLWFTRPPFNHVYTWKRARMIEAVASLLQAVMTIALCYEFILFIPVSCPPCWP